MDTKSIGQLPRLSPPTPIQVQVRKGHGALNDVVMIDGVPEAYGLLDDAAVGAFVETICNRGDGFGGADGVYFVDRSRHLPVATYYNSDGSAAEYCGNGLRCVGRYLLEATDEVQARVSSGGTSFEVSKLPLSDDGMHNVSVRALDGLEIRTGAAQLNIGGVDLSFTLVLAPNPHLVAVVEPYRDGLVVDDLLVKVAEAVRKEPGFEAGVNVSLAIRNPLEDDWNWVIRTDERGAGLTPSCASGAVAAAAALVTLGYEELGRELYIRNVGGPIVVRIDERDGVLFPTHSGNATWVFDAAASVIDPLSRNITIGDLEKFEDELISAESLYWENANYLRRVGVEARGEELQARATPSSTATV